jgi:hypothetical protein
MLPEISVHRPRGVWPKVAVQKRTVVDYQPSWLLVAIPALAALSAGRRRSKRSAEVSEQRGVDSEDTTTPSTPRRRGPAQMAFVAVPRRRRRPVPGAV